MAHTLVYLFFYLWSNHGPQLYVNLSHKSLAMHVIFTYLWFSDDLFQSETAVIVWILGAAAPSSTGAAVAQTSQPASTSPTFSSNTVFSFQPTALPAAAPTAAPTAATTGTNSRQCAPKKHNVRILNLNGIQRMQI